MNTLAFAGPGPWILLFPFLWAAVIFTVVTVLRRTVWRGRRGPWQGPGRMSSAQGEHAPIAILGRRFASGEIDEEEYWRRLSVLDEQFGPLSKGGSR
ncbi:SHOCT domain-containing protein [Streptomyces sp. NPDC090052]|uniref:SHOCT domain-containing protein n=1 Tax=unclassified Streptomyces TaxID=2593676 RepID=UPI0022525D68|nr:MULTISPECIES: SHOCT domain-containing protein [unclassified Streptomyces]MCX4728241.1 SHOCT domain-containing protein [Streptomyces sp. NBC_01306]WSV02539.1 SHOCT domain-containing protein [Streptomyces sp. NBC_01020]WSX40606.1 SHOCT domain-containing protein [Streptomyces sp. NBC_00963]WSX71437.1 SHOCT domain-containing protein [Streptomyces sp. NBC_00932]